MTPILTQYLGQHTKQNYSNTKHPLYIQCLSLSSSSQLLLYSFLCLEHRMYFNVLVCEKSQGMGYNGHFAQRTNGEPLFEFSFDMRKAGITPFNQIGLGIEGEAMNENFGHAVSISADGKVVVVGAPNYNGNGVGLVRAYKFNSTLNQYVQIGPDINGEASLDRFGFALSLSADGTTLVVGSPYIAGSRGRVSVYKFDITFNGYLQMESVDGEATSDLFGYSVAISANGTAIVVGAPFNDWNGTNSGRARVFRFNSTTNTYAVDVVDIYGNAPNENFGFSVSMSGDGSTIVVGAPKSDVNGIDSGLVRVYKFNSATSSYSQFGSDMNGGSQGEQFGFALSISGDASTIVAGAPNNNRVSVYTFDFTSNSYVKFELLDGAGAANDFGASISTSKDGKRFVVGARANNGSVRVYSFNSSIGSYAQIGLDIDGDAANDQFGFSVRLSDDGTTFVVGAPYNDRKSTNAGLVRVYYINSTAPTNAPTKTPVKAPPTAPTRVPSTAANPTSCGLLRWNFFCPRRGKCGFFRRLFGIHGC